MQSQAIPFKPALKDLARYAAVALAFLAASLVLGTIGRAAFVDSREITLRPELAIATLLLIVFGWRYVPVAFVGLLIETFRSPSSDHLSFVLIDGIFATAMATATAYFVRRYWRFPEWGTQRDFLVLGLCVAGFPLAVAAVQMPFVHEVNDLNVFLAAWLACVVPLTAIVPAGIKLAEWRMVEHREPLLDYIARGVRPSILVAQYTALILATGFLWFERVSGSTGRIFPLFMVTFWMALSSGLVAAAVGVMIAEGLLVAITLLATGGSVFDAQLSAAVMGSCAVLAGGLVTARRTAEEQERLQGEALRRQLAEMQVIRRLADAIIALRDENVLFELGAESMGERFAADQVWLLWIPAEEKIAEERGFWANGPTHMNTQFSPKLCSPDLAPLWQELEVSQTHLVSRANEIHPKLAAYELDVVLHQACGIRSLVLQPFSFEPPGFYVAAILSFGKLRHWTADELQFVRAISDQITIALQKTRLLGEREERSRTFARMSQALVAETGESFFRNLVLRLSEAAGSLGAYACRLDKDGEHATMLAFAESGKSKKEFTFPIAGTPVEVTLREGSVGLHDVPSDEFAKFTEISAVDVRGFASTKLTDSRGEPLGTLAVFNDKPLEDADHVASVLRLFAARASAEIERTEREQLLRESEANYRQILETAHEGIWIVDKDGITTYVNLGLASMLGYTPQEMLGKGIVDFAADEEQGRVSREFQRQLSGASTQEDFRFKRHDGSFVWTLLSMSPIRGEDGEFRGSLAMLTDISERKLMEQDLDRLVHERTAELVASNRELEAFCYSISHDLRQPLRAIDGFSRAAVEDLGENVSNEVKDDLSRVRRAANRMSELIDALLTLSRLNRVEMSREPVDLSKMAEEIIEEHVKADPERANGYIVRKGLHATGDARLLHVALENLIGNAWKFSSRAEHPFVEVGSKKIEGKQWIFVKDNGIGFDMAYSGKLFKPFERLHSESEFYGTGIGLATVARIVTRHGGQIRAEGAVGAGATFYFNLG